MMDALPDYRPKIAFICQPEYFRFTYDNALNEFADVQEFKLTYSMKSSEFEDLIAYHADFFIFFRGEYVPNEVLTQLEGIKINLSSEPFPRKINNHLEYSLDSIKRYVQFRRIRNKPFDYVFHYDAASLGFMEEDGLFLSGEFAFPVSTKIYQPLSLKDDWDIFFIGRSTNHRERLFAPLKHELNFLHVAHGIWSSELTNLINRSTICLNIHAEDEISWEPRLQMLLACRAFVISEPITPNPYFQPGIDYIEVTNKEELYIQAQYYLLHEGERNKIAENGYRHLKMHLTSEKAFMNLLKRISEDETPKFESESGSLLLNIINHLWKFWKTIKRIS